MSLFIADCATSLTEGQILFMKNNGYTTIIRTLPDFVQIICIQCQTINALNMHRITFTQNSRALHLTEDVHGYHRLPFQ